MTALNRTPTPGPAARGADALDAFFDSYYRLRPVNATFTGVHEHDHALPSWAPDGLGAAVTEMRQLREALAAALDTDGVPTNDAAASLDLRLADGYLAIQIAEHEGNHCYVKNPALYTGEAVFGVVSLLLSPTPCDEAVAARLRAVPQLLRDARASLDRDAQPASWRARALDDCAGALALYTTGLSAWLATRRDLGDVAAEIERAAADAHRATAEFANWLSAMDGDATVRCGDAFFALLLEHGHWCRRDPGDLLGEARDRFQDTDRTLRERIDRWGSGGWPAVQSALAGHHPTEDGYLAAFSETWERCHAHVVAKRLVTWPDFPLRYVRMPPWARSVAPHLYFLHYRAPAPFDLPSPVSYLVPEIDGGSAELTDAMLRAVNHSVITLNHVVHHGAVGHHVQNAHAYRSDSRIGRVAAVDCANRIGMFLGGSMAEGWACYATDLMDETGFLSELESIAEQHSRLRQLARAIVDIELHSGGMTESAAVAFHMRHTGVSETGARKEVTRTGMFPGTALMYWLGTQAIHDLRAARQRAEGAAFALNDFHDRLLRHGSIPVLAVADLMANEGA